MSRNYSCVIWSIAAASWLFAASGARAQVFDSGPSDSSLFTAGVFNVPPDAAPSSVGNLQQLNLTAGGNLSSGFDANTGAEVNVNGGTIGSGFDAFSGSEVNISGGTFGGAFEAMPGSEVNISGGTFGIFFDAASGSNVQLIGNEFQLNGVPFTGDSITLLNAFQSSPSPFPFASDVFTGTLQDGSTFIFASELFANLEGVTLTRTPVPDIDLTPVVVDTPITSGPSGLRAGQTLTLQEGGQLPDNFGVVGGTLNIEGGDAGFGAGVAGGVVNISGGTVDALRVSSGSLVNINGGIVSNIVDINSNSVVNVSDGIVEGSLFVLGELNISGGAIEFGLFDLTVLDGGVANISGGTIETSIETVEGSQVNISGGTFDEDFEVDSGSEVNLFGSDFALNGEQFENLAIGQAFTITDRGVTLTGVFADGEPFSFGLSTSDFDPDATLTITLVPEPSSMALIAISGVAMFTRRRR